MIIYKDIRFDIYLQDTYRRGGIAAEAARKAEDIICRVSEMDGADSIRFLISIGQYEHRISGCRKVGLPGGYRLVFIVQENKAIFCYVGEHDECFRWIEANKRLRYEAHMLSQYNVPAVANNSKRLYNNLKDPLDSHLDNPIEKTFILPDEIQEVIFEEQLYVEQYEQSILSRIYSQEGQRALSEWFCHQDPTS